MQLPTGVLPSGFTVDRHSGAFISREPSPAFIRPEIEAYQKLVDQVARLETTVQELQAIVNSLILSVNGVRYY